MNTTTAQARKWIAQFRYDDSQAWTTLGSAKPLASRAKAQCRELLTAEPNNAHRLQFRLVSLQRGGVPWEMSAPPHGKRMRWDLIPGNSPYRC